MSSTHATRTNPPRVRDQARERLALMLFSAATSAALAGSFLVLARLGS